MKKYHVMIAGDSKSYLRQYEISKFLVKLVSFAFFIGLGSITYVLLDYFSMLQKRELFHTAVAENKQLKNEAKLLVSKLDSARESLSRVNEYTQRIDELVNVRLSKVSKKTGIGPLSEEEFEISQKKGAVSFSSSDEKKIPFGVSVDDLMFRPILASIDEIDSQATTQAIGLQRLLSKLQKRSHLLSTIPMAKPVEGWYASGYGYRISPFTGKRTMHRGIDIAASVGTPIYAPADGVVVFSGNKSGFGKFIMIAHGHGIVTHYGHNAQLLVKAGERIKRGAQIATVGMTGRTTGPHLHYEVWVNGRPIDPLKFILSADFASL